MYHVLKYFVLIIGSIAFFRRPRYSLVVEEDVKKPTKQTNIVFFQQIFADILVFLAL